MVDAAAMRAVVIRTPGPPDVLTLADVPSPSLPPHHVRVRVRYAGVNRADLLQRQGHYPAPPGAPADIPGLEYVGVVLERGLHATLVAEGARVMGIVPGGAYADEVVVHEREVAPVPAELDDRTAGALPEAFVTALDAFRQGDLQAGETVLIHACGSGVGTAAIALAGALGCTAIGTSRTDDKLTRCKELGLAHGIHCPTPVFADEVRRLTGGRGADVVLDLVGGAYFPETLRAVSPRGRVVVVGLTAGRTAELDLGLLLRQRISVRGTVLRARPLEEKIAAAELLRRTIAPLAAKGLLRPVIDRVFPLAEAAAAHELVASNTTFGKVLLDLG